MERWIFEDMQALTDEVGAPKSDWFVVPSEGGWATPDDAGWGEVDQIVKSGLDAAGTSEPEPG